jgi:hypothetical protein
MAKQEKEKCSKCGSTIFAKATDKSGKLYCQAKGCGNVWVPGLEGTKRVDVVIKQLQLENQELKTALNKEREQVRKLTVQLETIQPQQVATQPDIFD